MQFAPGDLVRHKDDGQEAEVILPVGEDGLIEVKTVYGSRKGRWHFRNVDLDIPAMIARERERLAADIIQAIRDGLLPEGWNVKAFYDRGGSVAELRQDEVLKKVLQLPVSDVEEVVGDESSTLKSGNVSSTEPVKESENPDKSHVHAVYTTFDPVSGSGGFIQSGFDGSIDPAFVPKYPVGSLVRWAGRVTKCRVMAYNHDGYRIEAAEGIFRDSWSKIPESALSPWVDLPGDPPSRVRLVEDRKEPHEIVIVSDQDGFDEVFYVDGKRCDGGLSDIGWVIDGGTCTIESIEVELPDDLEDWPEFFDPAWRKEKKSRAKSTVKESLTPAEQPKPSDNGPYIARFDVSGKDVTDNPELWKDSDSCYRVPTEDDFGKMVEVRDSWDLGWKGLRLIAVLPQGCFRFCAEDEYGRRSLWQSARIKTTVSPTDSH